MYIWGKYPFPSPLFLSPSSLTSVSCLYLLFPALFSSGGNKFHYAENLVLGGPVPIWVLSHSHGGTPIKLIGSPGWALLVSILWLVIGSLSGVSRCACCTSPGKVLSYISIEHCTLRPQAPFQFWPSKSNFSLLHSYQAIGCLLNAIFEKICKTVSSLHIRTVRVYCHELRPASSMIWWPHM